VEDQNTEWKETWHDEYLKSVCGFANAQGGVIEIGRNDKGIITGVKDAVQLLDELPNKIRATMGILVDVNLRKKNALDYVVIKVKAYPNAVSYRGKYYLRSGSTNQEVTGFALDEMILRKYGRTWDSAPVPRVKPKDFYHDAFDIFRKKAVSSGRLTTEDVAGSDEKLLQALKLVDGKYLLKAALLLFHHDPEQWCLGSYVKIGYFKNDADILYQDEINGPLISIADRIMDTIYTKYFKGLIHYEGIQRVDKFPMSREVLREAVLNAVIHKDYSKGNPIHIKIYDDKVIVYNDFILPPNTTAKNMLKKVGSWPHNPLIASSFFRSGQIEAWGRGIEKMKNGCIADNLSEPEFDILPGVFIVCFHIRDYSHVENDGQNAGFVQNGGTTKYNGGANGGANGGVNEIKIKILDLMKKNPKLTAEQIANSIKTTKRRVEYNISQLKKAGMIDRIGADKNGHWVVKLGSENEV
jgi:ATP-dependent DNA helicase RecG